MLKINNLNIEIENMNIVSDINFELGEGEVLGIIGESGSGKSMICRSILGLNQLHNKKIKESGKIIFNNKNVLQYSQKDFQKLRGKDISIIFQNALSSLNPLSKIGKQIEEVFSLHTKMTQKEKKEETIKLLEEVQINNPKRVYSMYPHELSGGMAQRIVIAMAIALKPKLLIADEPTTSLDSETEEQILKIILKLAKKYNTAVIFVSHDLTIIEDIADKILLMKDGKVIEYSPRVEFFENPKSMYAKQLIKCTNLDKTEEGKFYTLEDIIC